MAMHTYTDINAVRDAVADVDEDADTDTDTYIDADAGANADAESDANADAHKATDADMTAYHTPHEDERRAGLTRT